MTTRSPIVLIVASLEGLRRKAVRQRASA